MMMMMMVASIIFVLLFVSDDGVVSVGNEFWKILGKFVLVMLTDFTVVQYCVTIECPRNYHKIIFDSSSFSVVIVAAPTTDVGRVVRQVHEPGAGHAQRDRRTEEEVPSQEATDPRRDGSKEETIAEVIDPSRFNRSMVGRAVFEFPSIVHWGPSSAALDVPRRSLYFQ